MTTHILVPTFKLLLLITKYEAGVTTQLIDFDTRSEADTAYQKIKKDFNESQVSFSYVLTKLYEELPDVGV